MVGGLCADQYFEQSGFAGTVGADDTDDGARGKRERKIVDKQFVTKALGELVDLYYFVTKSGAWWDVDLVGFIS